MKKPKILGIEEIKLKDMDALKEICEEYLDFVDDDAEYHEDHNYDDLIFERAMKVFFGQNVFDYINERQD